MWGAEPRHRVGRWAAKGPLVEGPASHGGHLAPGPELGLCPLATSDSGRAWVRESPTPRPPGQEEGVGGLAP